MLTLVLAGLALAADPAATPSSTAPQKETFATGQNATTVFEKTTLTKVGNIKSGDVSYELRCGTVSSAKTCSAYDSTGKLVATSTNVASLSVTNKPRKRLNEAELVRMLREGENPDDEPARATRTEAARPMITDPALARAIDLLKALAVVRHTRS